MIEFRESEDEQPSARAYGFQQVMGPAPPGAPLEDDREELSVVAPTARRISGPESRAGPDQRGRTDSHRSHHGVDREDRPRSPLARYRVGLLFFWLFLFVSR